MIYRGLSELPADFGPAVATIGNFDGVHLGHAHVMRRVAEIARERGWTPAVLTFDPHPARLVAPERAPKLITALDERCRLMQEQGIERVVILPFTPELAKLTPEEFVRGILVDKLRVKAVLVGENFRFGNRAAGDTAALAGFGARFGFTTEIIHPISIRGSRVSSTGVRQLIESGAASRACRMLGRPYALEGAVVAGRGVGSKQTVPTLNLRTAAEVLPGRGVYITRTRDLHCARQWPSVTNAGYRPTFGGEEFTIETFLLAPLEGSAPERIRVDFLRYLRDERKFESPEALRSQILRDVARTQGYFRRLGRLSRSAR